MSKEDAIDIGTLKAMWMADEVICQGCGKKIKNRYGPNEDCICNETVRSSGGVFFARLENS